MGRAEIERRVEGYYSRRVREHGRYLVETLERMASLARRGFGFNALSTYSDPERRRGDLYYANPLELFHHGKTRSPGWWRSCTTTRSGSSLSWSAGDVGHGGGGAERPGDVRAGPGLLRSQGRPGYNIRPWGALAGRRARIEDAG